ncbi:hypothetical protein [Leptolyngbya sp. 'hensonii']|nr:hypothetical protein [Leptolyngbya sp. 'hensonii']
MHTTITRSVVSIDEKSSLPEQPKKTRLIAKWEQIEGKLICKWIPESY